jgi:hypothetical protein
MCPSTPSAIMSTTWGLDAQLESRVKAGLSAAANLEKLAVRIEGQVASACGGLAKDLGATDAQLTPKEPGPGKRAEAACSVAAGLLGEYKAKVQGTLSVRAQPPRCSASMDAMADCAARCDANVQPGQVDVRCEGGELSGRCGGQCQGTCTVEGGARCEGSCSGQCTGACDAGFSGRCDGACEGKCDGQTASGKCAGTCEGKCGGGASGSCSGTCKGQCSAACEMQASGQCEGTCTGQCSVEMEAPKCTGNVEPPRMSAECEANCDAEVSANVECTPGRVDVSIQGADAQAAARLRTALSNNLPQLLEVTVGLRGAAEEVVGSVQTSLQGLQAVVQSGAEAALKVGPCVAAALQAQARATATINVSIEASASASASANAG